MALIIWNDGINEISTHIASSYLTCTWQPLMYRYHSTLVGFPHRARRSNTFRGNVQRKNN